MKSTRVIEITKRAPKRREPSPDGCGFSINSARVVILEALLRLPSARISDIARSADKDAGTVANILPHFLSRGIVQKIEGTELYQLDPRRRRAVAGFCSDFRAIFPQNSTKKMTERRKHET